jgi:hypothetical protein
MAQFLQAAPILVTCDLDAAMRRYASSGSRCRHTLAPMADGEAERCVSQHIAASPDIEPRPRSGVHRECRAWIERGRLISWGVSMACTGGSHQVTEHVLGRDGMRGQESLRLPHQ